ncbi:hypothetical protein ABT167_02850 [Streptomyces sp. NPDC001792]|uniref:hypothetical protein n=1 Tax=Streptomyces sp. NPDC001792 TaxID=3154524 RepID=UPI00331CB6D3
MVVGFAVAVVAVTPRRRRREGAARQLVRRGSEIREACRADALGPGFWFVQDAPYENDDLNVYFVGSGCKNVEEPLVDALAKALRNVKTSEQTVYANSSVIVYSSPAFAQADASRIRQASPLLVATALHRSSERHTPCP